MFSLKSTKIGSLLGPLQGGWSKGWKSSFLGRWWLYDITLDLVSVSMLELYMVEGTQERPAHSWKAMLCQAAVGICTQALAEEAKNSPRCLGDSSCFNHLQAFGNYHFINLHGREPGLEGRAGLPKSIHLFLTRYVWPSVSPSAHEPSTHQPCELAKKVTWGAVISG